MGRAAEAAKGGARERGAEQRSLLGLWHGQGPVRAQACTRRAHSLWLFVT